MKEKIRFGICADVHCDLIPDAAGRIKAFAGEMNRVKPDFVVQLGDFCQFKEKNRAFMEAWNSFEGPKYHVIGNHDNENAGSGTSTKVCTHEEVLAFWGSEKEKYYSFDCNGFHFVALLGSEGADEEKSPDPENQWDYAMYFRTMSMKQRRWLAADLDKTGLPVILFIHEYPDMDTTGGLCGGYYTRRILELANEKAGFQKVRAVFTGHHHMDYMNVYNGIYYVGINSMSFQWLGKKYAVERIPYYTKEEYREYVNFDCCIPYTEPLWGLVSVYENGEIRVQGKRTTLIPPTPEDIGLDEFWKLGYARPTVPWISDWVIPAPL
jgi:3',5'-cyclic AMP phosphodiesterase CpdA